MTQDGEYLSANDLIEWPDIEEEDCLVPEFSRQGEEPKKIRLRTLTVAQMEEAYKEAGLDNAKLNTLVFLQAVIDPKTKKPLFARQHYDAIKAKSAKAIGRVMGVVLRMNGLGPEVAPAAVALFPSGQSDEPKAAEVSPSESGRGRENGVAVGAVDAAP